MITDPAILAYIRTCGLRSHGAIKLGIARTFGVDHSDEEVRHAVALARRPGKKPMTATIPNMEIFIMDRMDLLTLDEIVEEGRATFGAFPSRSQVHRLIEKRRTEDQKRSEA